jgi:putative redox protein
MANNVKVTFNNKHQGILETETYSSKISFKGEGNAPYELFLGGFASCLHATFLGIMKKRKVTFENIVYDVTGHKREEVPTFLNKVITNIVIEGVEESKQKQVIKSMEQAEKYCSISQTIYNLDAEMILNIEFK